MFFRTLLANGQYVTITTRKHSNTNFYFGWASVWRSKHDYEIGNCDYTIEVKNIPLGTNKDNLKTEMVKFTLERQSQWAELLAKSEAVI